MKIVALTSNQLRHRYFVNCLNAHFPLAAVGMEKFLYSSPPSANAEESEAWDWFFSRRWIYEFKTFGPSDALLPKNIPLVFRIRPGALNRESTTRIIKEISPDLIVVYGTGLLGPDLLQAYGGKILNLHVGLPEHYRGSGCNFWPIHNERLDHLGAAIHLIDQGIDTGNVLAQERIALEENDDEQSLAGKVLILGVRLLVDVIQRWETGEIRSQPHKEKGRLYLMKDFTPARILNVKKMIDSGHLQKLIRVCK